MATDPRAKLLVNARSGRAAVQTPAPSLMLDDGEIERRVRLLRPMERSAIGLNALASTEWQESTRDAFAAVWNDEVASVPEFRDQQLPHRHRPVAADLDAPAVGELPRLPASDR